MSNQALVTYTQKKAVWLKLFRLL